MNTQQPNALRLAHALSGGKMIDDSTEWADILHAAAAELHHLQARNEQLEKSESDLITERDYRDEIIDLMADVVLGTDRAEWSSSYDFMDAVKEIEYHIAELEAQLSAIGAGGVEPLRKQVAAPQAVQAEVPSLAELEAELAAVNAAPAAQAVEPEFFTVFASHNGGKIALPGYSNETEKGVKDLVLHAARQEGYKGTVSGRLLELGWWIGPVFTSPPEAAAPAPAAMADEGEMFEAWARTHEDAHGAFDDRSARAGWQARAALAAPQAVHPENIREGAPYDNPEFEQLARAMGIWGTPQAALCAQFWLAATHPTQQGLDAAARELIDRLQDAQQDINLAANTHMSQQLASAAALLDEVESTLRALSATQPAAQGMDSAISESVLEAVKAINRGNGDGRTYRAALGWIVVHLNPAVARSLAVDPSGKVALPLATALAAQAKQKD